MNRCEHCSSTDLYPFTPAHYARSLGAVHLCRSCGRLTITLPSHRPTTRRTRGSLSEVA